MSQASCAELALDALSVLNGFCSHNNMHYYGQIEPTFCQSVGLELSWCWLNYTSWYAFMEMLVCTALLLILLIIFKRAQMIKPLASLLCSAADFPDWRLRSFIMVSCRAASLQLWSRSSCVKKSWTEAFCKVCFLSADADSHYVWK